MRGSTRLVLLVTLASLLIFTSWAQPDDDGDIPLITIAPPTITDELNITEPPENDDFDNAVLFTGTDSQTHETSTEYATTAGDDPIPGCDEVYSAHKSVWYAINPGEAGTYLFTTLGSNYDTFAAVWEGDRGNLNLITCSDDEGPPTNSRPYSEVIFDVTADETVYVMVSSPTEDSYGDLKVRYMRLPTSSNDDFDNPVVFTGPDTHEMLTDFATTAGDDPTLSCETANVVYHSVWYELSPGVAGSYSFETAGSDYNTVLSIWQGERGDLELVTCNDDTGTPTLTSKVTFDMAADDTYYAMVSSYNEFGYGYLTVSFQSTDTPEELTIDQLMLVNRSDNTDIFPITDGMVIELGDLPTDPIDIVARTTPDVVGSVSFGNGAVIDNTAPYTLAFTSEVGEYTVTAAPYSEANAGGSAGTGLEVNFTVVNEEAEPTETASPTDEPEPTDEPTEEPTETASPTDEPEPTDEPTEEPTETASPTDEPEPTDEPTVEPTAEPTDVPTVTIEPTPYDSLSMLAPLGSVSDSGGHPTYVWTHTGASGYHLYIAAADDIYSSIPWQWDRTLQATQYCTGNTCAVDLTDISGGAWLVNGAYQVWVHSADDPLLVGWEGPFMFQISEAAPGNVTMQDQTGDDSRRPVLNWTLMNGAERASWFQVYLAPTDDIADWELFRWISREEACSSWESTTCSIQPSLLNHTGQYSFYVRAWNPGGLSNWAGPLAFTSE